METQVDSFAELLVTVRYHDCAEDTVRAIASVEHTEGERVGFYCAGCQQSWHLIIPTAAVSHRPAPLVTALAVTEGGRNLLARALSEEKGTRHPCFASPTLPTRTVADTLGEAAYLAVIATVRAIYP